MINPQTMVAYERAGGRYCFPCHSTDHRGLRRVFIKNECRYPGPEVLELRAALVDHERGSMKDVPVKLHYDNNRRVTLERRDYFYAPLPGTPFGLAVAIPNYGTTWIKVIQPGISLAHTHC